MIKCHCGKECKNQTGLATHQRFHCKGGQAPAIKKKVGPCDCKDGGDWSLLNRSEHAVEIASGHKKYCTVCMEVI